MSDCNGKPITAQDLQQTEQQLQNIVVRLKSDGFVREGLPVDIHLGVVGTASVHPIWGIQADPRKLSCLTYKEQDAVFLHETGHYNDLLIYLHVPYTIAVLYLGYRTVASSCDLAKSYFAPKSPDKKKHINALWKTTAKFFAAHLVAGGINIGLTRPLESRADLYSAHVLNSGEPLKNAFIKFAHTHITSNEEFNGIQSAGTWELIKAHIFHALSQGPLGYVFSDHPSYKERIEALERFTPDQPKPFGMRFPTMTHAFTVSDYKLH